MDALYLMNSDSEIAQSIRIEVDGQLLQCLEGDSVAAAIIRAGRLAFWREADAPRRGYFCGTGLCQQCLITVDGEAGHLACNVAARDGMTIGCQPNRWALDRELPDVGASSQSGPRVIEPQVLVVGGGPAGLIAATVAAELGAQVTLLDQRPALGGLYFMQAASRSDTLTSWPRDRQFAEVQHLIERAKHAGVIILTKARVWAAFANKELAVLEGSEFRIFRPQYLVIASGSYEITPPLPGWTLAGVMTSGAAQGLNRGHGVIPGRRILVAGNGPHNLQVALELHRAGAEIVAVTETAPIFRPASAFPLFQMFLASPSNTLEFLYRRIALLAAGIPVLTECRPNSIEPTENQLQVTVSRTKKEGMPASDTFDVDIVCLGFSSVPSNELLRLLGCHHQYDDRHAMLRPSRDVDCQTSIGGVFAIGDCCGVRGAPIALQEGTIAATRIATMLGLVLTRSALRSVRQARKILRRQRSFRGALCSVYHTVPFAYALARPDTLVCQCENITYARIETALSDGHSSLAEIKRCTRLGMGACQGRYCLPLLLLHLLRNGSLVADEFSLIAPRIPITPVRLHDLPLPLTQNIDRGSPW